MVDFEVDYSAVDYNSGSILIISDGSELSVRFAEKVKGDFPEAAVTFYAAEQGEEPGDNDISILKHGSGAGDAFSLSGHLSHIFNFFFPPDKGGLEEHLHQVMDEAVAMGSSMIHICSMNYEHRDIAVKYFNAYTGENINPALLLYIDSRNEMDKMMAALLQIGMAHGQEIMDLSELCDNDSGKKKF